MKESDVINRLTEIEKKILEEILQKEKAHLNFINLEDNKAVEKSLIEAIYTLIKARVE